MEEAAKAYWENPSLVIALSIAVFCLGIALVWLVKWVLNKLVPVLEKNTTVLEAVLKFVASSDREFAEVIKNNTKAVNELTTEHKILINKIEKR